MELDDALARRLATQHLTGGDRDVLAVVEHLLAVQAQDAPLARWSLAMRTGRPGDRAVCDVLDSGGVLRTHVLRPTWHFVAAADLRWLLALTSPAVLRGMGARSRALGLAEPAVVRRDADAVLALLADGPMTRRALQQRLDRDDLRGERLGHLLLIAELEALICSGPLARGQHTYVRLDERVPPAPARGRAEAIIELVARFLTGHGPASVAHLARWTTVTGREVAAALHDLGDRFAAAEVDGERLWFDADGPGPAGGRGALLLPVFDEAYLTYPTTGFPRSPSHPWGARSHAFAEAGGGAVISDLRDVGWWRRTETGRRTRVALGLDPALPARRRRAVEAEAAALAAHTGRSLELVVG